MAEASWTTSHAGDVATVALRGEIDASNASDLERALERAMDGASVLAVDMRELGFMDSSGLRAILRAHAHARGLNIRFVLIRGTGAVDRLLRVTALEAELEVVDDPSAVV